MLYIKSMFSRHAMRECNYILQTAFLHNIIIITNWGEAVPALDNQSYYTELQKGPHYISALLSGLFNKYNCTS